MRYFGLRNKEGSVVSYAAISEDHAIAHAQKDFPGEKWEVVSNYEFNLGAYEWTLAKNGNEIYSFDNCDEAITKETDVQDILDMVVEGIEVMCFNAGMEIDIESDEYWLIEDCMFSTLCNHYNIH